MTDLHRSIMTKFNVDYPKAKIIAFAILYGSNSFSAADRGQVS